MSEKNAPAANSNESARHSADSTPARRSAHHARRVLALAVALGPALPVLALLAAMAFAEVLR